MPSPIDRLKNNDRARGAEVITLKLAFGLRHHPVYKFSHLMRASVLLSGCMNKILYGRQR